MFHRAYSTDGSHALHEQSRQELPERQRATAERRQRGASESTVARLRFFSANLDGHQPRGRNGDGFDAPGNENQGLFSERRAEATNGEDAVSAEAGEDHEDTCAMPDALSHETRSGNQSLQAESGSRTNAACRQVVESHHRSGLVEVREHGQHRDRGASQVSTMIIKEMIK